MQNASRFARSVLSTGLILSGLLLAALMSSPVSAATETNAPLTKTVTVNGSGMVEVEPDLAILNFNINLLFTGTAVEAQKESMERAKQLENALTEFGVEAGDIRTTWMNMYPEYDYNSVPEGTELKNPNAYRLERSLEVRTHDVEHVNELMEKALEVENVTMQGVNYSVENPRAHLDGALESAAKNALEKAQNLGKVLKFNVGKIISVTDGGFYYEGPYYGGGFAGQKVQLPVNITVTFELMN